MTAATSANKQRGRPFVPGHSGNPSGRPSGARNHATVLLDKMAQDEAAQVLRAVLGCAIAGDMSAATLVLARVWQPRKGRPVALDLPQLRTATDLASALGAVVAAVANATISPEEGQAVAAIMQMQVRAIEVAELEQRITLLENTHHLSHP